MPSARKMQWAKFRVAATSFVALLILGVFIALLTGGTLFVPKATLRTYMPDAAGLDVGSPVRLNGIPIGKISKVRFSGSPDPNRVIEVDMQVAQRYLAQIPRDSSAAITAENVQGDKYLDITRGKGVTTLRPGAEVPFQPAPEVLKTIDLAQFDANLRGIDKLLADIQEGKSPFSQLILGDDLYRETVERISELERAVRQATSTQQRLGQFLYKDTLYQDILRPVRELDDMLAKIQRGEGSTGRLLRDSRQYDEIRDRIGALRTQLAVAANSPFLASDDLYTSWNKQVAGLIRSVDDFNASPMMLSAQGYESLNGSTRAMGQSLHDFLEDPRKYLRMKVF